MSSRFVRGSLVYQNTTTVTSGDLVVSDQSMIVIDKPSGAATAITLPASPLNGHAILIKDGKGDAGTNNITITPASGTIDGAATQVINTNYGAVFLQYSATQGEWGVLSINGGSVKAKELTATYSVPVAENGFTYFLNATTEFVTTLPAPFLGAKYRFVVKAAPTGASYTVVTSASANIIKGSVYSADLNAASDGDIETSGADTISLVDSKAVAGDSVDVESDGTSWFARGFCSVFDAITYTTAS